MTHVTFLGGLAGLTKKMEKPAKEVSQRPRGGYNRGRGGQHKAGEKRQTERRQYVRRPVIRLQMDVKEIKLNEEQTLKIKELDEQIKAVGKPVQPSLDDKANKLGMFDEEVAKMNAQIEVIKNKIDAIEAERQEYLKKNAPELAERTANSQKLRDAKAERERISKELELATAEKLRLDTQYRERKMKSGVKSKEAAEAKILELEELIETKSMTNQELKKHLGEIDHLHAVLNTFDGVDNIETKLEAAKKKERELRDLFYAKRREMDELFKQLEQAGNLRDVVKAKTQAFLTRKDEAWTQIKEIKGKINEKFKEKHAYIAEFDKQWEDAKVKKSKLVELEYEKKVIYSAAERTMLQVLEGQKKFGDIKERVNPYTKQINAATSLIAYLGSMLDEKVEKEDKKVVGKKIDDSAMALIASLRKPVKGKKETKKSKPVNLVHSLDSIAQFAVVEMTAPTTLEQVKPIIDELTKKVQVWKDAFAKAVVNFAVQADGKVSVSISMA